jgi:hypothetical protein
MSATIELNPPEMLAFNLVDPSVAPKSILTVTNKGNQKIAFKVKTTKPRRYLVRPNQGLVDAGQSTEVTVILQQKDCEELLNSQAGQADSTDKFLVQSAVVSDSFYADTLLKPQKEQTDELSSMWQTADKKSFTNKKLKCDFKFGQTLQQQVHTPSASAPISSSAAAPAGDSSMFNEVSALRKKYDELVAFDAELMQERDKLSAELKKTKQELEEARAVTGLRQRNTSGSASAAGSDVADTKKTGMSFALAHLLIVGAIFFILGRLF